jgi:hypothetical protein
MEHPLNRLRALTGCRTVDLATEVTGATSDQAARNAWSRWLNGRRAPKLPQLARLVALADQAGDSALAADIMRWAIDLGAQLAEEPTVVIPAAEMAAMAAEDAP